MTVAREPRLRPWSGVAGFGAAVAITTRHGGVSVGPFESLNLGLHVGDQPARVVANRERAAAAFGVDLDATVFAEQVHGSAVAVVGPAERGRGTRSMDDAIPATDILLTTDPGTTLVMLVADCVPVALIDPAAPVLAVVHAGWRGTAAQAVAQAVAAMAQHGGRPERMVAYLGPAVHPSRYQVDTEVQRALARAVAPDPLAPEVARADGPDHWRADLIAANRQQLVRAGLRPANIYDSGASTADDDYFSDRACRPCGRFALLARLLA
ncbi:MAG TPA: polyphenol oxidase family protein [Acidimicrobiales bacterium]|nr:polyphenol oxidase family protein [Acidimicrobiales bacterium]